MDQQERRHPGLPRRRTARAVAAAELLLRHRLDRLEFDGFPEEYGPRDEAEAYETQSVLHELLSAAGHGEVVGHKIGCTTPTMQAYLRIPRPAAGGVFDSTVQQLDGRFRHADLVRPGVECELAVRLSRDLDARDAPFDRKEVEAAVGSVMAAIELVDDRYSDWGSLGALPLIADDFFGAGCVLGAERQSWRDELDLSAVSARMTVNGVEVGAGVGADILGDPVTALLWLVNEMTGYGHSFRRGTFVLLGSLVQTHWVEHEDVVVVENDPLGTVTARFS
jgi:2-oxo-3-hexenedioate decarboxylase/2-keto-4-pentenoate hydratase